MPFACRQREHRWDIRRRWWCSAMNLEERPVQSFLLWWTPPLPYVHKRGLRRKASKSTLSYQGALEYQQRPTKGKGGPTEGVESLRACCGAWFVRERRFEHELGFLYRYSRDCTNHTRGVAAGSKWVTYTTSESRSPDC